MSYEAVNFFVKDTTVSANPVAGVLVRVFSQDGRTAYTQTETDAAGRAGFLLEAGVTYQARFYKFQIGFTNPQFFQVSATQPNTFDVAAEVLTPPTPLDARLCTAFGYFRDATGAPKSNTLIHFTPKFDPTWLEGAAVINSRIAVRADETGYAQVNLIRNGQYDVTIQGEEDLNRPISVPDAANVNLADLVFPVVARVVFDPPGPHTLAVGERRTLDMHVLGSDGQDLGTGLGAVMYLVRDTNVLQYECSSKTLTLIGVGAGTTQLELTRADQSIVRIPDPGIQGQPLVVTVTA